MSEQQMVIHENSNTERNIQIVVEFSANIKTTTIKSKLDYLVEQHQVLRTAFKVSKHFKYPMQNVINETTEHYDFNVFHLSENDTDSCLSKIEEERERQAGRIFKTENGECFSAACFTSLHSVWLLLSFSPLVTDTRSLFLIAQTLK
jgi:hypothetical protein